jgi:hypothetical protein
VLNPLLDLFIRDFITYWYHPLLLPTPLQPVQFPTSRDTEHEQFQRDVRRTVHVGVLNLIEYGRHFTAAGPAGLEVSSLMTYGFANAFIVHLVSCLHRQFLSTYFTRFRYFS